MHIYPFSYRFASQFPKRCAGPLRWQCPGTIKPPSNHLKLGPKMLSSYSSLYYHDQTSVLPNSGGRLHPCRRDRQPVHRCCYKPRCCCPWRHLLKVSEMLVTNNANIENWIFFDVSSLLQQAMLSLSLGASFKRYFSLNST